MTHVAEFGAEKPQRQTGTVVRPISDAPDMQFGTEFFWYQFLITNTTFCMFGLVYNTSFLVGLLVFFVVVKTSVCE